MPPPPKPPSRIGTPAHTKPTATGTNTVSGAKTVSLRSDLLQRLYTSNMKPELLQRLIDETTGQPGAITLVDGEAKLYARAENLPGNGHPPAIMVMVGNDAQVGGRMPAGTMYIAVEGRQHPIEIPFSPLPDETIAGKLAKAWLEAHRPLDTTQRVAYEVAEIEIHKGPWHPQQLAQLLNVEARPTPTTSTVVESHAWSLDKVIPATNTTTPAEAVDALFPDLDGRKPVLFLNAQTWVTHQAPGEYHVRTVVGDQRLTTTTDNAFEFNIIGFDGTDAQAVKTIEELTSMLDRAVTSRHYTGPHQLFNGERKTVKEIRDYLRGLTVSPLSEIELPKRLAYLGNGQAVAEVSAPSAPAASRTGAGITV